MSGTTRRRTEPVDAIWLSMDRPSNRMVIVTLMFLATPPDWDEVVRLFQARVLDRYPVFTQRPVPAALGLGLPWWQDDPAFDLDRHIRRLTLAAPGDDQALQSHVEDHLHLPLDREHPLWEVQLIDGHRDGAVVFARVHHAMADGISLARVLMSLTDGEQRTPDEEPAPSRGDRVAASAALVRDGVGRLARLGTPSGGAALVRGGTRTAEVAAQLLLTHSPTSLLSGSPSTSKRVVWTGPMPLDALKGVSHGARPVDLVTMVPVNLRPLDRPLPPTLGNRFALVFFTYPSGTPQLLARLAETKRRMDWLKHSPEAPLTYALMGLIARTAPLLERALVDFFADKAVGVTTNVVGPTAPRMLAGVPVTGVLGWVPGSGRHVLGTCIFTYAGSVRVGLMADAAVVHDPETLLAAFEDEVAALVRLAD
jgi:diacylglycerol O-acyltransferase